MKVFKNAEHCDSVDRDERWTLLVVIHHYSSIVPSDDVRGNVMSVEIALQTHGSAADIEDRFRALKPLGGLGGPGGPRFSLFGC